MDSSLSNNEFAAESDAFLDTLRHSSSEVQATYSIINYQRFDVLAEWRKRMSFDHDCVILLITAH